MGDREWLTVTQEVAIPYYIHDIIGKRACSVDKGSIMREGGREECP